VLVLPDAAYGWVLQGQQQAVHPDCTFGGIATMASVIVLLQCGCHTAVMLVLVLSLLAAAAAAARDESAWAAGSCYASLSLGQVFPVLIQCS